MKKKYIKPDILSLEMETESILAGSGSVESDGTIINLASDSPERDASFAAGKKRNSIWDFEE